MGFDVFKQTARHFQNFRTGLQSFLVGDQGGLRTLDDAIGQLAQAMRDADALTPWRQPEEQWKERA